MINQTYIHTYNHDPYTTVGILHSIQNKLLLNLKQNRDSNQTIGYQIHDFLDSFSNHYFVTNCGFQSALNIM